MVIDSLKIIKDNFINPFRKYNRFIIHKTFLLSIVFFLNCQYLDTNIQKGLQILEKIFEKLQFFCEKDCLPTKQRYLLSFSFE